MVNFMNYSDGDRRNRMAFSYGSPIPCAIPVGSFNEPLNFIFNTDMGRFPNGSVYTITFFAVILLVYDIDDRLFK